MGNNSVKVKIPSVYLKNCVEEVAQNVYGRDNRKPIHDVIQYLLDGSVDINTLIDELGLVVQNGKLCVVYDPTGGSSEPYVVPTNIRQELEGILTDVYGSDVRQDIVNSFTWSAESFGSAITFIRNLGLIVEDGKLCVTYGEDYPDYSIPSYIQEALNRILTDVKGTDLRDDIVKLLRWALTNDFASVAEEINDLGLSVVDGKLCIEYGDDEE